MCPLELVVKRHFPEFVRADYPVFIEFVETYYKWLATQTPGRLEDIFDIHNAPDQFVKYFQKQLDVYGTTSPAVPFDRKYLTNIKEIYGSKGSQQGLTELLRIISNTDVSIDYPSDNILRASDGRWEQQSFITITLVGDSLPVPPIANIVLEVGNAERKINIARTEQIAEGVYRIFYLTDTSVTVTDQQVVKIENTVGQRGFGLATRSMSRLQVVDGGLEWQVGQVFVLPATGVNTIGRVVRVGQFGNIEQVEILIPGYPHTDAQTFDIYPSKVVEDDSTKATLRVSFDVTTSLPGRWKDERGQLSNDSIRLQDNFFYQQFSYVINSEVPSSTYAASAQASHLAGTKAFNTLLLTTTLEFDIYGWTEYPFRIIQLGPDLIEAVDSIIKIVDRDLVDELLFTASDEILLDPDKYITDEVHMVGGDEAEVFTDGLYDSEDYFEVSFNNAETIFNIT